eukprot:SAG22_NODE_20789_length_262_cov_1.901840_1_plen_23_part_10
MLMLCNIVVRLRVTLVLFRADPS